MMVPLGCVKGSCGFMSACSFTKDKTIAEAAVTAFNEQYSAGEFTEIFEAADPRF
jgi:hypothetical protein